VTFDSFDTVVSGNLHARARADPDARWTMLPHLLRTGALVEHHVSRDCRPHSVAARRYVQHRGDLLPNCRCRYAEALRDLVLDVVYGRSGKPPIVGIRVLRRALWLGHQPDSLDLDEDYR
jgi:hypothetical protein